jgi:transcription initiation factor TFIIB
VSESRVTNGYETLNEKVGLPARPVTPSKFAPRLASDLGCPDAVRQRVRTLAEDSERAGVTTGVHPAAEVAAACRDGAGREEAEC